MNIYSLSHLDLESLEKLDLSYNLIENIDDFESININKKIKYINFQNNRIDYPFSLRVFLFLDYLNISNNKIDERYIQNFKKKYLSKCNKKNISLII